ncbi:DUF1501 domain-containing protein [Sphingomonas sp. 2R-10]|uniref:DUF1501 domain-containing protein n=1 Tax=Sphingomonas sp. 2R-10 TaxID=3045148 RepID=UPI000F79D15D|nr:DUF1501 domain-containing protein [Sphingomonas sp. 2R-10]MDJ0276693.1 DUF1501 domain-containing protein [Sphingomonas sp. 2R-10]
MTDRRHFLIGGAAALSAAFAPRLAYARAATELRFVFVIQRGAADGLATVMPTGDPGYAALRGAWGEDAAAARKLDAMFALHPALSGMAGLYDSGQALFAHAIASPYRDRSHFDGQNVLETGGAAAYAVRDGWLNRLLTLLPREDARAIAVAATVPLALRGTREVASYAPSALPDASGDLMARVTQLYAGDAQLHALWAQAVQTRQLAQEAGGDAGRNAAATGTLAARLLAPADGARIAMIETGGWDTHAGQRGRLNTQLKALDAMVAALRTGLGTAWSQTLVLVATEFGRTARINGTGGTDHGTATATMMLGGTVLGKRVVADWPGLSKLYEDRDLTPTTDLDALIAGAVAGHFGIDPARTMATLFPGNGGRRPVAGLIRA